MFGIGMQELMIILVVALLVLGPTRLPQVARTIGKGLREVRKASDDLRTAMLVDLDEERSARPPAAKPALPAALTLQGSPLATDEAASKAPPGGEVAASVRAADGTVARGSAPDDVDDQAGAPDARGCSESTALADEAKERAASAERPSHGVAAPRADANEQA